MDHDRRYLEQLAAAGQGDPFCEQAPEGFRSAEDRRRLKSRALKTAISAAVLDVVAPVILIFGVFFSIFSSACDRTFVEGAVLHGGQIYYARSVDDRLQLLRTAPDGVGGAEEVAEVEVEVGWLDAKPRLVLDGRQLLLITRQGTFRSAGGQLVKVRPVEDPGRARPFAFRGRSAIARYDYGDEAVVIATLQGRRWRRAQRVELALPGGGAPGRLEALEHGGKLHLFTRTEGTIYHCAAIPGGGAPARCGAVAAGDANWSAALVDGAPALFQLVEPGQRGDEGAETARRRTRPRPTPTSTATARRCCCWAGSRARRAGARSCGSRWRTRARSPPSPPGAAAWRCWWRRRWETCGCWRCATARWPPTAA